MNNLVDLTSQLVSIPSWVDESTDENQVTQFCYEYLKKNSKLTIKKQFVTGNRFNITAQNNTKINNLVVGHIDTVQPSSSWTKNPIKAEIIGERLYGLGTSDMKSGVAIMLDLACNTSLLPNTMFLFYIDEEYDFLGMEKFIDAYQNKIQPKQVISLDGSNLSITNGCRGLIEITCTIRGLSGHAAKPNSGINAIVKSNQIITQLFTWLDDFVDQDLGSTAYNLAYISGGQYQGGNIDDIKLGRQGNVIPDICQFIIDIRPSNSDLTAKKVTNFIKVAAKKQKVAVENFKLRHNLGSWLTTRVDLKLADLPLPFNQPDQTGYIDIQMLWLAFNRVPCFTIGAGDSKMAHKPDEFVRVDKLIQLQKIIKKLLTN